MFNLTSATKFFLFFFAFFFFSSSFTGNKLLAQQVSIQSVDTKTGTAATTHSLTGVTAGTLLVLSTTADAAPTNSTVSSSPSLTWTKRADAGATSSDNAEIWTAVYSAGGSITVTSNWGSNSQASVCYVVLNAESTLGGASGTATLQAAPSVTITTTAANSILFGCTADWNARDGATRTLRDAATERLYNRDGNYTTYFYTKAAATIGSYTEGVSVPNNQQASTALLEIRSGSDTQAPSAISNLSSPSQTSSTINLSWTAATDNVAVTGYDVYVGGVLNGNTTSTTYTVTGLTPSTQYSIYVKAKDAAGNGTNSNTITPTTAADTEAPSSFTLSSPAQTVTTISLSWTAATDNVGVTGYDVYVGGVLNGNTASTTYTVTGLTPSTQYSIYVKAKDAAGNGTNSNTITPTTAADTEAPSSFTLSSPAQTVNTVSLSWTAATDNVAVTAYDVYVGGVLNGNTASTTYTVTGLAPSTQYSIYVKAKDAAGNGTNSNTITPTTAVGSIIDTIYRTPGIDSFYYKKGTTTYAVKDSTGTAYTNAQARSAVSLTTTGSSGAATYNNTTGVLNIPDYSNGNTWNGVFGGTSSSGGTVSIGGTSAVQWLFTGSSPATWTLPDQASNGNRAFYFKNEGTADLTVQRAGTDQLFTTAPVNSITIIPGESRLVMSGNSYWHVHSLGGGDTSGIDTIYRTPGIDSIKYVKGGITYSVKDSVGAGVTPTLEQVLAAGNSADNNITLVGNQGINFSGYGDGSDPILIGGQGSSLLLQSNADAGGKLATFKFNSLTANRNYIFPNESDTLAGKDWVRSFVNGGGGTGTGVNVSVDSSTVYTGLLGAAASSRYSTFLGRNAGYQATNAPMSNFIGNHSGYQATYATYSNFLGNYAGSFATNASSSTFIGSYSGHYAANAKNSIFIGRHAGNEYSIDNSVTGTNNGEFDYSILIGRYTRTGGFKNSMLLGGSISPTTYIANTADNQFMLAPNINRLRFNSFDYDLAADTLATRAYARSIGGSNGAAAYSKLVYMTGNYTIADSVTHLQVVNFTPTSTITLPNASANTGRTITIATGNTYQNVTPAIKYNASDAASGIQKNSTITIVSDGINWLSLRQSNPLLMTHPTGNGQSIISTNTWYDPTTNLLIPTLKRLEGYNGISVTSDEDAVYFDGSGLSRGIDSIYRTPGVDSIKYVKNGITYAVKDSAGGGYTPTLQQVFNTQVGGSLLTKSDTINLGTSYLTFNGSLGTYYHFQHNGSFAFSGTPSGSSRSSFSGNPGTGYTLYNYNGSSTNGTSMYILDGVIALHAEHPTLGNSTLNVYRDSIELIPDVGNLFFRDLVADVGTKTLRYNPTTGKVTYADTTVDGGSSSYGIDSTKWGIDSINVFNKNIGNVGIGTINPTAKFHTLGSMRFESFKNNEQGDSILTTDANGNLKLIYMPYGSSGGGDSTGGISYTFENGVSQSNGHVRIGGSLQDSVKLNLNDKPFHFNSGSNRIFSFTPNGSFYNGNTNYDLTANSTKFNIGSKQDSVGYGSQLYFNGVGNSDGLWMSRYNAANESSELRVNTGDDGGSADKFQVGYLNGGVWKSNLVVQANGQAGVGTSELNGDLSVGTQHGDKLSIGNNAWANKTIITTGTDVQNGDFTELKVPGSEANSAYLRLNKEGSVGIGTTQTDAGYKLLVNGRIKAVGLRVKAAANWPDYVFDSVYQLRPLSELEKFIKANKHLPEFPKAAEVDNDGHDVSETQIKLLQKIEELTLYIIDQDKRVKELEDKNKKLDDQNKQIVQMQQQLAELKKLILTSK